MAQAEAVKVPEDEFNFAPMTERERLEAIDKVKAKLASIVETSHDGSALTARVRLLRLWQELASTRGTDYVEPEPSVQTEEPLVTPETEVVAEHGQVSEEPAELHPTGSVVIDSSTVEHSLHVVEEVSDTPKPHTDEALEQYGPFLPKPAPLLSDRIRLRMIKEGVIMNRRLPPGTIVLVYPLDGEHLIEQGIAEILPAHADEPDTSVEMLEF